ncbi:MULTISPECIES: L-threonylcarbamoyladenylate synthase [Paenibacillus]|uniref:L-threonylcarbamoyladenylate synthase n=1 Tax=Paenibacillus TaxID=44249 RepID=UPI0022B92BE6|nr:L-threonylcarbamoyladenylate synthase [Paenibacillus caseinilyticus]MCZ8523373.1 L-threonylcarbamoyladenylate synthase [Paenibacillus caseinilyticus]
MMSMTTKQWKVEGEEIVPAELAEAASLLREGGTVAFPTETVYGLGADARRTEAVAAVFAAKGRPSDNPLIVHIAERSQLEELTAPPEEAVSRLLDAFWPGPLTVVLPVRPGVLSPLVTAGLSTVGVRMPDHPVARALIAAARCPVAAPSANRSGRPSPTRAAHVLEDLGGRIGGIVDGGEAGVGLESTVVEYTGGALHILRPGGVTSAELRAALPGVPVIGTAAAEGEGLSGPEAPRAPGMKYAHYAPQGAMLLVQGSDLAQKHARIQAELDAARQRGERTGVFTYAEHAERFHADHVAVSGRIADLASVARGLYDALRSFDEAGVTFIAAEACPETGIGAAVMNRLRKAAGGRTLTV